MNDRIPVLDRLREELVSAVARHEGRGRPASTRRRWVVAVAATTSVAAAAAGVAAIVSRDEAPRPDRPPRRAAPSTLGPPESPIGGSMTSCAETFSVETLRMRDFAFDGVITDIVAPPLESETYEPTLVTFEVTHWYRGGPGDRVVLKTSERPGGGSSLTLGQNDPVTLEVGQRVLGSGEEDFLWSCGFSMLHTANNAALFEAAFE